MAPVPFPAHLRCIINPPVDRWLGFAPGLLLANCPSGLCFRVPIDGQGNPERESPPTPNPRTLMLHFPGMALSTLPTASLGTRVLGGIVLGDRGDRFVCRRQGVRGEGGNMALMLYGLEGGKRWATPPSPPPGESGPGRVSGGGKKKAMMDWKKETTRGTTNTTDETEPEGPFGHNGIIHTHTHAMSPLPPNVAFGQLVRGSGLESCLAAPAQILPPIGSFWYVACGQ